MAVSKGLAGVGHCEEDLQGCISHGSRSTRDMFIRNVRRGGGSLGSLVCGILVRLNVGYVRSAWFTGCTCLLMLSPGGLITFLTTSKQGPRNVLPLLTCCICSLLLNMVRCHHDDHDHDYDLYSYDHYDYYKYDYGYN